MDPTELPVEGPGESQLEHHKNHINCIRNGGTPNCNVDLALRVQTILSLAEKSYRQSIMSIFDTANLKVSQSS